MKYISEFEDPKLIRTLLESLKNEIIPSCQYRVMEFCGGHTHVFYKTGLIKLLPEEIKLVHGPGCPVCVLPSSRITSLLEFLHENPHIIVCTYADLLRVPGKNKDSLMRGRERGLDIRAIYSPTDALTIARNNPSRKVIFFAIGFETTTPPTALSLLTARRENLKNYFVYCNHLKTGPALDYILRGEGKVFKKLDGLIGPGQVATVLGSKFFDHYAKQFNRPIVISGFSSFDLLKSLILLVKMINEENTGAICEYSRAVKVNGNEHSLKVMNDVLEDRSYFEWRGLGKLSFSSYKIKNEFSSWDAEDEFAIPRVKPFEHPHCKCSEVLLGEKSPRECKLYEKVCTPENPLGPCMVSSEGACSAYYNSGMRAARI